MVPLRALTREQKRRLNGWALAVLFLIVLPLAACAKKKFQPPVSPVRDIAPQVEVIEKAAPVVEAARISILAQVDAAFAVLQGWGKTPGDMPQLPAIRKEADSLAQPVADLNAVAVALKIIREENAKAHAAQLALNQTLTEENAALKGTIAKLEDKARQERESRYSWVSIALYTLGGFGIPAAFVAWYFTRDRDLAAIVGGGAVVSLVTATVLRYVDELLVEWGSLLGLGVVILILGTLIAIVVRFMVWFYRTKLEQVGASVAKLAKEDKTPEAFAALRQAIPQVDEAFAAMSKGGAA